MTEDSNETEHNGKKIWLAKSNAIIFALLFTILGVNLGFLFLASSGFVTNTLRIGPANSRIESAHSRIDSTNGRIIETHRRIDGTHSRINSTNSWIIDVQSLFVELSIELRKANRNVAKQDELVEQLVLNFDEVFERLAKLESEQEEESQ